jgi:type II restriction/modification system DNA methylase subunit YeeA
MIEKFIGPRENNSLAKAANLYNKLGKNAGMFFVTLIIFILFSLSSEAIFYRVQYYKYIEKQFNFNGSRNWHHDGHIIGAQRPFNRIGHVHERSHCSSP